MIANLAKAQGYSESKGVFAARKAIMHETQRLGIKGVTVDDIILGNGVSELIVMAMQALLDSGDEVLIPMPDYPLWTAAVNLAGGRAVHYLCDEENGWNPAIDDIRAKINANTKAIVIINPNNPTGYLYSKEEIQKLGEIAKKYDLFLFADEVYREFVYDNAQHFSVMHLKGLEQNVVLLDSVSKRYSACGVRTGAFVTRNKEVYATAMKLAQARLSPPLFGQILGEAAVDTPQSYFDAVAAEYVARRNTLIKGINAMPGCFVPMPKGAFYSVARLPIDNSDRFCKWLLEEFSYNGETVMLAPATGFYHTKGKGTDEVRVSYCLNISDLRKALKCLEEALKVYPGRKI